MQQQLRDTCAGPTAPSGCTPTTTLVSIGLTGTAGEGNSYVPYATGISADGRFVQFNSAAENLVTGTTVPGAFVRDTCIGAPAGCVPSTVLVSVDAMGNQIGSPAEPMYTGVSSSAMSRDGHFVAFEGNERIQLAATGF